MKTNSLWKQFLIGCLFLALITACAPAPSETTAPGPTATTQPTIAPTASETPAPEPTATIEPTITPLPPTPVSLPEYASSRERSATFTVCTAGCTFRTIQEAIDNAKPEETVIIEILDAVHTESGIVVHQDIILRGLNADRTIVQAHESLEGAPERVFLIERNYNAVFEDLTIQHGKPAIQDENGGGIMNYGGLVLNNCIVTNNRANGGGGISNSGDLMLIDSTVNFNLADGMGSLGLECGNGGGIQSSSGKLILLNSTVSHNHAGLRGRARGGGLHIGCGCKATIINSTISNNEASREGGRSYAHGHSDGGGIYAMGELRLVNTTISNNRAKGEGGGIFVRKRLDYVNTIIANNVGKGSDCVIMTQDDAMLGENNFNLVGDGSCDSVLRGDPLLEPLTDNGGPTDTHALLPGSPALDIIPTDYCMLTFDQRGQPRPLSSNIDEVYCDLGAFEYQP